MKHCIPIQEISQIEIECTNFDIRTDYFKFKVSFIGTLKQEFNLTSHTFNIINERIKAIVNQIKENKQ